MEGKQHKSSIERIEGYLHKVIPVTDKAGNVINHMFKPLMVEFRARDLMQTVVGSTFLAIPVSFTEEAWMLGAELPLSNIIWILLISLLFLALFIFLNYYRQHIKGYEFEYVKRVLVTYLVSMLTVGILLTLIDKCPWGTDPIVAFKRIVIVTFPASMSATLTDLVK